MAQQVQINARYRSTLYESDDGGCVVVRATEERTDKKLVLKGSPECGPTLVPGLLYRWYGCWTTHPRHGEQFAFAGFAAVQQATREGVVGYLKSVADRVSDARAAALWDRYGPLAVETLRGNPDAVAVAGIMGLADARAASHALDASRAWEAVRIELFGLLGGRGMQLGVVIPAVLQRWGARAPDVIRRNPYVLLDMQSVGWKRADELYRDLGLPLSRLKRQALLACHHMAESGQGDTWHDAERVCRAVEKELGGGARAKRALTLARRAGLIRVRRDATGMVWVALAEMTDAEARAAESIGRLAGWTTNEPGSIGASPTPAQGATGGT